MSEELVDYKNHFSSYISFRQNKVYVYKIYHKETWIGRQHQSVSGTSLCRKVYRMILFANCENV